jgi:amidohydrolase
LIKNKSYGDQDVMIRKEIARIVPDITAWRHNFHAQPETAFEEKKTSNTVASILEGFGLEVHQGLAGTGVVGILKKGTGGKSIGLRADMDALDIREDSALPYRSVHVGKMHACGHDGHMAMLLGAAKCLSEWGVFNGTVYFIFQPAEENEGGAGVMVREGFFDRFSMDAVFGMHNLPSMPLGYFAIKPGPMMAGFDIFDIIIQGGGGHAAIPHRVKDPLLTSSYLMSMLQSVVSRNVDPAHAAVVSVTRMSAGTNYNIIPEKVLIQGTVRYFDATVQDLIEARMREIVEGTASAMGVKAAFKYERRYPPLVNSEAQTAQAVAAAKRLSEDVVVNQTMSPMMGSEDFAFMLQKRPGAYIHIGAGEAGPNGMLHQAGYDFNDALLPIGASYWVSLVELLLS